MSGARLQVDDLQVRYRGGVHALRGVSVIAEPGEVVAIVGESGSGKSTLLAAIMGLLPPGGVASGAITLDGVALLGRPERELRGVRGRSIGFVPQNPFHAVDPLRRVSAHLTDAARAHGQRLDRAAVRDRLRGVGIAEAYAAGDAYPHQWSGGMLQRGCIAGALIHDPPLLLADEPTSALDADTRQTVLAEMLGAGRTTMLVTHDIAVARAVADEIVVLYHGRVVERGSATRIGLSPRHPYTAALLESVPREDGEIPDGLDGSPPPLTEPDAGCAFASRCVRCGPGCEGIPELHDDVRCHHPIVGAHG